MRSVSWNPYTFVPTGEVLRDRPGGHATDGDGFYCGLLTLELTLKTPLLLP